MAMDDHESVTPIVKYRRVFRECRTTISASASTIQIPLMPLPKLEDVEALQVAYDSKLDEARRDGDRGARRIAYYHATWARKIADQLRTGNAPTTVDAPIHVVRIGDGAIATAPGEAFAEFGMAVKERSPAAPTMYAAYTNDYVGYLPTEHEYAFGGYRSRLRLQDLRATEPV